MRKVLLLWVRPRETLGRSVTFTKASRVYVLANSSSAGSMRTLSVLLAVLIVTACGREPTAFRTAAPPTLRITGTNRVVSVAGVPQLEVSASLRNPTTIHIKVAVGEQCPLFVRLYQDTTGEPAGSLNPSMACPPSAPTRDLAPGDTAVLIRVLRGDSLASLAPGTYGINIAVTTSTALMGTWGGFVQLPLALVH